MHIDGRTANLQPLAVAKLLAKIAAKETPDLVIVGKQVNGRRVL